METDTAALVQLATDMDDLALQFDGMDAGKRFIEAWKRARIIVDTGGGHSNGGTPTPAPHARRHTQALISTSSTATGGLRQRRPLFIFRREHRQTIFRAGSSLMYGLW